MKPTLRFVPIEGKFRHTNPLHRVLTDSSQKPSPDYEVYSRDGTRLGEILCVQQKDSWYHSAEWAPDDALKQRFGFRPDCRWSSPVNQLKRLLRHLEENSLQLEWKENLDEHKTQIYKLNFYLVQQAVEKLRVFQQQA